MSTYGPGYEHYTEEPLDATISKNLCCCFAGQVDESWKKKRAQLIISDIVYVEAQIEKLTEGLGTYFALCACHSCKKKNLEQSAGDVEMGARDLADTLKKEAKAKVKQAKDDAIEDVKEAVKDSIKDSISEAILDDSMEAMKEAMMETAALVVSPFDSIPGVPQLKILILVYRIFMSLVNFTSMACELAYDMFTSPDCLCPIRILFATGYLYQMYFICIAVGFVLFFCHLMPCGMAFYGCLAPCMNCLFGGKVRMTSVQGTPYIIAIPPVYLMTKARMRVYLELYRGELSQLKQLKKQFCMEYLKKKAELRKERLEKKQKRLSSKKEKAVVAATAAKTKDDESKNDVESPSAMDMDRKGVDSNPVLDPARDIIEQAQEVAEKLEKAQEVVEQAQEVAEKLEPVIEVAKTLAGEL